MTFRRVALVALSGVVAFASVAAAQPQTPAPSPFSSDAQALAFLRHAEILSMERIPTGVTEPRKVLLEKDGIRAYAVFRDVDLISEQVWMRDGTFYRELHDSAMFEVAAYRLATWLGFDNVPPTVVRSIGARTGSLQLWIEGAMTETHRRRAGLRPPDYRGWLAQMRMMTLFDCLIGNIDRHGGNYLLDGSGKLWMIDHTRAFQKFVRDWTPGKIAMCEWQVWNRLQRLDRETLDEMLSDVLTSFEIKHLEERLEGVVAHLRTQIALRGEHEVIIDRPLG